MWLYTKFVMALGKGFQKGVQEDERKLSQTERNCQKRPPAAAATLEPFYSVADKEDKSCRGGDGVQQGDSKAFAPSAPLNFKGL